MFAAPMGNMPEQNRYGGHAPAAPQPQYTAHAKASPITSARPTAGNNSASPLEAAPVASSHVANSTSVSMDTNTINAKGDLLKNKVSSLLKVAEEPETDEFLNSLPSPKKRFGFFKK